MAGSDRRGRGIKNRSISDSAGIAPFKIDFRYLNAAGTHAEFLAAKGQSGENSSSAEAGDFYFDTTNNTFQWHNGSAWVSGTSPVGQSLTSGRIWVGSAGNLAAAVAVSGDVTLAASGAVTIGAKKVTAAMLQSAARGNIFRTDAASACSELSLADGKIAVGDGTDVTALSAKGDGKILVGNGTTLTSVAVSGDATLSNTGAVAIPATASAVRSVTTDILAADVITLNATPVVVVDHSAMVTAGVAAAGDALIFQGAIISMYGGTNDYDQDGDCKIKYDGGVDVSLTLDDFCNDGTVGSIATIKPLATDLAYNQVPVDTDLQLYMTASPFNAAGNRNVRITVFFSVFTPHA